MSTEPSSGSDGPVDPEAALARAEGATRSVWEALRSVQDPELPLSVVDLGLIYDVTVSDGRAEITMTLTYSGCPAKDIIVGDIERAVYGVDGVDRIDVETVYNPTWDYDRITEQGRAELLEYGIAIPGYEAAPDPNCH